MRLSSYDSPSTQLRFAYRKATMLRIAETTDDCITCDSNNARQIFSCQRSDVFRCLHFERRRKSLSGFPEQPPSASFDFVNWWAWVDSNYRPHPYQGCALTN